MEKKMLCFLMVTLILTSVLNGTFVVKISFARVVENEVATISEPNYFKAREDDKIYEQTLWDVNKISEWSKFVYVDGNKTRLIVGVNGEGIASFSKLEDIAKRHQATIANAIRINGEIIAIVVELPLSSVTAFMQETRVMELVSYIEPNMRVQAQFVPNDPYWGLQWGPKKIGADWAWNTTVGSSDILVAVIDTGIYYYHADLAANYVALGYDWVNMDADPIDDHGHGTHCAGIIAATINNGVGIAGLAQVRIMAEKVLNQLGWGYADWVANGIIHATERGARIISMSLGGYGYSELLHEAVKYAFNNGVLLVAAAGNDNTNTKPYPAGYDEVIAVSATDQYDGKAWFSNWGDWVELSAPGVDIISTVPWGYASWSGTSMACPHVSGVAALVWSLYPEKTRDWVRLWLRYTADDLGDAGFDVYYGYGRINARKAVEQTPPAHELIAYKWVTPPYVKPGALATINAAVLNFGENNETNINVQLFANSAIVDSASIGFLASGHLRTVSLTWSPTAEGLYNVTLYVVPVPGETSIENNVLWKYIYVGFPVKAVVLHSAGNFYGEIITNWQVLNSEWRRFGDTMVYIDYVTLNKEDITYEDLADAEADVLIISCAYDPWMGWQFTDSEIEAIKRYVYEGHGLIATAGTLYYQVPNNNKLAPLFGLNETTMWAVTGTDLLHLLNITHPLFKNVPNPLVFRQVGTAVPYDGRWDQNELVYGRYLALGHYLESSVVVYRGLVYISPWLEVIPPYYHHHLQLLYNAITWSRYQKPQHELAVSLDAPKAIRPSRSVLLNATVYNMGLSNETDVELQLLMNGVVVNSISVPELFAGDSYTLSYLWIPTVEGVYNVTAYVPPLPGEENIVNNVRSVRVLVSARCVALFQNYDPWDYPANQEALNRHGVPYVVFRSSDFGRVDLSAFTKVVIASDQDQTFYNGMYTYRWWFEDYVRNGGILEIHAADLGWHGGGWVGPLPGGLQWATHYAQYVTVVDPTHDLLTTPNIITEAELDNWNYAVHGYFKVYPADAHIIIIEDSTGMPAYLEFDYGAGFIIASSQTLEWAYKRRLSLILENSLLYMPTKYEHDLSVILDAPAFIEPGSSTLLNATVRNKGLNNETNVELYLLINGTVVSSAIIPELLVSESYTINYMWTPTVEAMYNVTVYAPPVPGEELTANNLLTKTVRVMIPIKVAVIGDYNSQLTNLLLKNGIIAQERGWDVIADIYQYNVIIINRPNDPGPNTFLALLEAADKYRVGLIFTSSWPGSTAPYGISLLQWYLNDPEGQGDDYGQGSVYYQVLEEHPIFEGWNVDDKIYVITTGDRDHAWFWGYSGKTIANIGAHYTGIRGGGIAYKIRESGNKHLLLAGLAPQSYANLAHWTSEAKLIFVRGVLWASKPAVYEQHDIAILNLAPYKTVVGQGYTVDINVTVANQGDYTETFNVTLYANTTAIETKEITLQSGTSATITFTWDTTGFAKGNYAIWAYAWPVQGETDTNDNTFIDGKVRVLTPGNVNGDTVVDMTDVCIILRAYGTTPASPNWNPNYDINNDKKVDMTDVCIALRNYGKIDL